MNYLYLIGCLILGMIFYLFLKRFCGCKVVEGLEEITSKDTLITASKKWLKKIESNISNEQYFQLLVDEVNKDNEDVINNLQQWITEYYNDIEYIFSEVKYIDGATEYSSDNAKKHLIDSIKKNEILQINDNISDEQLQDTLKEEINNKLNTDLMHFSQQWKIWFYKDKAELPCSELKYVDTCRGHLMGKFWESCRDYYTICDTNQGGGTIGCGMVGCKDGEIVRCGEQYNILYRLGGCIGCSSLRCGWSQAWRLKGCYPPERHNPDKCSDSPATGKDFKGCDLSCKNICNTYNSEEQCSNNDVCKWCKGRCMNKFSSDGGKELECIPWCDHRNTNCDSCYVKDCKFTKFGHTCSNHYKMYRGPCPFARGGCGVAGTIGEYCSGDNNFMSCEDPGDNPTICRIPPNVKPNMMLDTLDEEQKNKINYMMSKYASNNLTESDKEKIENIFNSNDFDNAILEIDKYLTSKFN